MMDSQIQHMETDAEMVAESLNRKRRHGQITEAPAVGPVSSLSISPSSPAQPQEVNEVVDSQPHTKKARVQNETEHHLTHPRPSSSARRSPELASLRRQSSRRAGHANRDESESPRSLSPSTSQQMTADTSNGQIRAMQETKAGSESVVGSANKKRQHFQIAETLPVVGSPAPPASTSSSSSAQPPEVNKVVDSQPHTKKARIQNEAGHDLTDPRPSPSVRRSSGPASLRRQSSRRPGHVNRKASEPPQPLSPSTSQQISTNASDDQTSTTQIKEASPEIVVESSPIEESSSSQESSGRASVSLRPSRSTRVRIWEEFYQDDDKKESQDGLSGGTPPQSLSPPISQQGTAETSDGQSPTMQKNEDGPEVSVEVTASQPPKRNVRFRDDVEYRYIEPRPSRRTVERSGRHTSSRSGHVSGNASRPVSSRTFTPQMMRPMDDEETLQGWPSGSTPPPLIPRSLSRLLMKLEKAQQTEPLADTQTPNDPGSGQNERQVHPQSPSYERGSRDLQESQPAPELDISAEGQGSQIEVGENHGANSANNKDVIETTPTSDTKHNPKLPTRLPIQF